MLSQLAPDPIISRLRPRSVQEIIDQAFRLYRRYFFTFLAITAVVFVPVNMVVQLLNVALQGSSTTLQRSTIPGSTLDTTETLNESLALIIVLFLAIMGLAVLGSLLQYLSQGALTSAVADSHLDRPVSFGRAYRTMLKRLGPLLGAIGIQLLIGLGIFLPAVAVFMLSIASILAGGDSGAGAGFLFICLGFLLMFVSFFFYAYVFVRLTVIVPAIMVEGLGPVQAVRRSWQLVQGYWWRTLALVVVLGLINAVISAGPAYLVTALVAAITQSFDTVLISALTAVITIITEALFIPLSLTCYTLYYFDLRVRKEGFDLETALNQRYSYPGAPAPQGAAAGGYYAGQQGPYAPTGAYPPPALGYAAQPQYSPYTQQGQQYPQHPQQGYYSPASYSQPEAPSPVAGTPQGAPTLPSSPISPSSEPSPSARVEPGPGPLHAEAPAGPETPRAEGLGFSTPSITEQAAQNPGAASEPQVSGSDEADTPSTGGLEPPRTGSGEPGARER